MINLMNDVNEEISDISENDLITALTHSLDCAEALIESGLDSDLKDVEPITAKMYLSALLRIVQTSKKISTEIFVDEKMIH
jgi:hypothetical protein